MTTHKRTTCLSALLALTALLPLSCAAASGLLVQAGPSTAIPNFKSATPAGMEDNNETSGWLGVCADIELGKGLSFQPGVFYSAYRVLIYNPNAANGQPIHPAQYDLAYLEFPLLLKYKFRKDSGFRPYLFAGPNPGFLLSAKETIRVFILGSTIATEVDIQDATESLRLSADAGMGFEWSLSKKLSFVGDIRLSHGFTQVFKNTHDNTLSALKGAFGVRLSL